VGSALALCAGLAMASAAQAQETIKVGILHSLSGTMAISETTLKDVMLMLIEEQNAKGGVLGRQLEPVVVDPAYGRPTPSLSTASASSTMPPSDRRCGLTR
jgi:urea transport system substrate-binding protein